MKRVFSSPRSFSREKFPDPAGLEPESNFRDALGRLLGAIVGAEEFGP
jgi:hypothetical protein